VRVFRRSIRSIAVGLLAALALAVGCIYGVSEYRMERRFPVDPRPLPVASGPAAVDRGRHLVTAVSQCTTCHGEDLSGLELVDDAWFGRLWSSNLTPGRGGIAAVDDLDLVRGIRFGVRRDGTSLVMMPAQHLRHLSDDDLAAIIAYLRTLPPVERETPPPIMGPFARAVVALGLAPDLFPAGLVAAAPQQPAAIQVGESVEYGAYLVEAGGCKVCHNSRMTGGLHPLALPGEPEPPNLTPGGGLASWTSQDFVRTLRTGITRDGRALDPEFMPWPAYSKMSDVELRAIWKYLENLKQLPKGRA
jgi:mono/diheme cytochrome c family protein